MQLRRVDQADLGASRGPVGICHQGTQQVASGGAGSRTRGAEPTVTVGSARGAARRSKRRSRRWEAIWLDPIVDGRHDLGAALHHPVQATVDPQIDGAVAEAVGMSLDREDVAEGHDRRLMGVTGDDEVDVGIEGGGEFG